MEAEERVTTYQFPDFTGRKLLFKGRRYIVIEVSKEDPFDIFGDDEDFVVWDGLNWGAAAAGKLSSGGVNRGRLVFSHVEIEVDDATTMSDFVKNVRKAQEYYFKGCGV